MKRTVWRKLIAILVALSFLAAMTIVAVADFGDFSGDSDFGGSDSGSDSGGWDSDSWDSGDSSSGSSSSDLHPGVLIAIGIIYLAFFIWLIWIIRKDRKKKLEQSEPRQQEEEKQIMSIFRTQAQTNAQALLRSGDGWQPMAAYEQVDPGFDKAAFIERISRLYVQMQECWAAKNIDPLRPYFTDAQFAQYKRQLENNYIAARVTSHLEDIAVQNVLLSGWRVSGGDDEIVACIEASFVNYVTDDNTGKIVRGSKRARKYMSYEWTLSRKHGVITDRAAGSTRTICCPHCNAPLEINKTAKCEYCGSIVNVDAVDWVISGIKGLAQRTVPSL